MPTRSAFSPAGDVYAVVEPDPGANNQVPPSPAVYTTPPDTVLNDPAPANPYAQLFAPIVEVEPVVAANELYVAPIDTEPEMPGRSRPRVVTIRFPVPTSTLADTRSETAKPQRVAFGLAPVCPVAVGRAGNPNRTTACAGDTVATTNATAATPVNTPKRERRELRKRITTCQTRPPKRNGLRDPAGTRVSTNRACVIDTGARPH
ncbi:hypothetical protein [Leifsonia naganoensis]|uniref:Uncharacterized protein n=1 Tax=Leifsonia naganoensis TaxID=150025 RepID=A0A853DVX2_9MICO|nr:hypothetical protein [Leifsonia naganoensis]NYK11749.1 hypothetical protein [Leifsonia naganoensis]